jgi:hypothetical protein
MIPPRESSATTTRRAHDMWSRVWAVAELLAQAAHREMHTRPSKPSSEKTQD